MPAVLLLLLAGLGLRLLYLATPWLDSDQAIFGLMAAHILRGELPIFQWGYHYMGTIESFVAAPLMLVFGETRFALNLAPALFSMLFAWSAYLFARESGGRKAGLWALALGCFPPIYLIWTVVVARGAYAETLALGTLASYLALRAVNAETPREERNALVGVGLALGLAFWTHFNTVIYGTAILLFWLIEKPKLVPRAIVWAGGAFLLGSAPFWYGTIRFHFDTFLVTGPPAKKLGPRLWRVLTYRLPVVLGMVFDGGNTATVPFLSWLIAPIQLVALGFVAWSARSASEPRLRRGARLLLLVAAMLFATYLPSSFSAADTQRYLVPLYTVLVIAPGLWLAGLARAGMVIGAALVALQAVPAILQADVLDPAEASHYRAERAAESRLFETLRGLGLTSVYADQYWDGARFTFDSHESIVFATPFDDRSRDYLDRVDGAEHAAFLFHAAENARAFEGMLHLASASYRKTAIEGFYLFHDIRPAPPGGAEIPIATASASHNPIDAPLAFDRDAVTRWTTLTAQRPGMWLTLDLGAVRDIAEVTVLPRYAPDAPRGLLVEASADGSAWRKLVEAPVYWGPCSWARGRPLPANDGWVVARFPPTSARFVRLTELGKDRFYAWSVAEAVVRAPSATEDTPRAAAEVAAAPPRLFADPVTAARAPGAVRHWQGEVLKHFDDLRDVSVVLPQDRLLASRRDSIASGVDPRLGARAERTEPAGDDVLATGVRLDTDALSRVAAKSWRLESAEERVIVDLGEEQSISGAVVAHGDAVMSFPRGLVARISGDGVSWSEPTSLVARPSALVWTDEGLYGATFADRTFLFPAPVRARFLELSAAPRHPQFPWKAQAVTLLRSPGH